MGKLILFFTALLSFNTACSLQTNNSTMKQNESKKVLVAYFSATGTTERVAKTIANEIGAKLYAIEPQEPYTAADLDWHNDQSRSSVEMRDATSRPSLANLDAPIEVSDVILIGFPIWWYTCPTIINTFFESYDFTGKTVAVFCTSGGSSIEKADKDLRTLYTNITWKPSATLNGGNDEIKKWIQQLDL